MYDILNKYKCAIILILKGLLVSVALFFIVYKVVFNQQISATTFIKQLFEIIGKKQFQFFISILFSILNWYFEILKWQVLVSTQNKITFQEALSQTLASHTIGFTTPNKIGEYGAKAFFFEKMNRKKIMILNLIGNSAQLSVTVFFGLIGLFFLLSNFTVPNMQIKPSKFSLFYLISILLVWFLVKNYCYKILTDWFAKLHIFIKTISKQTYFKVVLLSVLRYVIFVHQFYFFLWFFGVETNYVHTILMLFCMYFIAAAVPNLNLFDWVTKSSLAVFLFGLLSIASLPIIVIVLTMWLLNFALPALIGSAFVIFYKPTFN